MFDLCKVYILRITQGAQEDNRSGVSVRARSAKSNHVNFTIYFLWLKACAEPMLFKSALPELEIVIGWRCIYSSPMELPLR